MTEQRQIQMSASARPSSNVAANALTPKDVLNTLRRHVWLIVILTIVGLFIGGVSCYLLEQYSPKYTAATLIKVFSPDQKDPTKIESPQVNEKRQYGFRLSIAQLIKQQSNLRELILREKVRSTQWFRNLDKISDAKRSTKAIKYLKKKLSVSADRDADFVQMSMVCGNKEEAALIVNEMADMFVRNYGNVEKRDINQRLEELEKQKNNLKGEVDLANKSLDEVRDKYGFVDLDRIGGFRDAVEERLVTLDRDRSDISLSIQDLNASIATLEKQATGPINEQVERQLEVDPIMVDLASQLAIRESLLAGQKTRFGENHKIIKQSKELIESLKYERNLRRAVIAQQVRQANLKNAQDLQVQYMGQLKDLQKRYEEADKDKQQLDIARVEYGKRVVSRDEREERLNETKLQIETYKTMLNDPEAVKITQIGPALPPDEMSSPQRKIFLPAGTFLGMLLGIGLAFLKEFLNDLVRIPKDVAKYLRIPLLGVIPDADEDPQADNVDLYHILRQAPYSFISESYRRLRTNLKLSEAASSSKVLLISSCNAGDGKTSVAVNLATSLVAENKKTLLIDANFWNPSTGKLFPKTELPDQQNQNEDGQFGLSTLLAKLCGYNEIIRNSGLEGLDIIDSGPLPSNPAELLDSGQMELLIKHQQKNYDYIIIDGPPVLLVSEAKILARAVGSTIMVLNASTTRRGVALRAMRELREVDVNVIGAVLFAVKAMKGGYFREQFKTYQKYQELQLAKSV